MKGSTKARRPLNITLSPSTLRGLLFIQKYRFLTIPQFAKCTNIPVYHAGEVLRNMERWGALGYFGFVPIPGQGKTPKVYYLKRRGWELLEAEFQAPGFPGAYSELQVDFAWTPSMYHRLKTIDLFLSLETQLTSLPHLQLVRTFLEHRRRETVDYVNTDQVSANRIVPDGAFVLENIETDTKALFFIETDMGTERSEIPSFYILLRLALVCHDLLYPIMFFQRRGFHRAVTALAATGFVVLRIEDG